MSWLQNVFALVMICGGFFFMLVGSIGVVRLPDFFSRTHAAGKSDTLGIMLVLAGMAVFEGFTVNSAKLLLVIVFVGMANPIGAHALVRAAMRFGLRPWFAKETDETKKMGGRS